MRFAIVTETYPPEINGVALTVAGLESGLRDRGHAVELVRPRQTPHQVPLAYETFVRSAQLPRYPGMRFGFPAARLLRSRWTEQRPDAVYISTEGPLGDSALRAATRLGIPVATGFHTRFDAYMRDYGLGLLQPLALAWMRNFHNRSDATLVPTRELSDFLKQQGFADIVHLPRAVDTDCFDSVKRNESLRASWGLAPDGLAVLYLGRIAAEKNLPLAVRAFRAVQDRRPDARFIWVGEGPALAAIRAANPDFVFCGPQRGELLAQHFASSDLFLFPSHSETFGNVTIEAMASGVATVAFRYGAAREHLRDGRHGASIEGRDEDAFVDAACKLALDDDRRQAMGLHAREAVHKLRPEQVAADFDDILQRIIANRSLRHARAALA
jgi:glycosyltransferase involved in cell wall biosynthesis